jgi:hypothetical protein
MLEFVVIAVRMPPTQREELMTTRRRVVAAPLKRCPPVHPEIERDVGVISADDVDWVPDPTR